MKLSMLDVNGAMEQSVELAPLADALGYERYWIAEHQPQPTPLLAVAILAGLTQRIRVGTAGILFHYYPPIRTAHDFHFLERAYEGRIDAGFCRGVTPQLPAEDLDGRDLRGVIGAYVERVGHLVRALRNTPGNPSYDVTRAWHGALDDPPQIWSLGSGELAARHGLYLGYSLLYGNSVDDPAEVQRYRERFVPDRTQRSPYVAVAVCGVRAPTDGEAHALFAGPSTIAFLPRVVGEPAACADQLRALAERYGADEIVFADRIIGVEERKRCYELLARELL